MRKRYFLLPVLFLLLMQIPAFAATSGTISGVNLFNPPASPQIGNYVFDAAGFTGNFDPIYWLANEKFSALVSQIYVAIEFFKLGSAPNGVNGLIKIVLGILHGAFVPMVGTVLPFVALTFAGLFVWYGAIKHDIHAIAGRAIKTGLVLVVFAFLASPVMTNSQVLQTVSAAPVQIGTMIGNSIEGVITSATHNATASSTNTSLSGVNLYSMAWDTMVLPEWVAGEEGQNYSLSGKVVPLFSNSSAWRTILNYPLQNGTRNNIATMLQNTPDGAAAFASPNRLDVADMAYLGNIGAIIYYFVMGAIMLFARLAFLLAVAAGAVILPLELIPITRSMTLTVKWVQYTIMSLFVIFFVSVYSAILFGLTQVISVALQGSLFSASSAIGTGGASLISDFAFLGNGLVYLVAIYIAWRIYKKLKPMQKIKIITDKLATTGLPLGLGQRWTAETREKAKSPILRGQDNTRRNTAASHMQAPISKPDMQTSKVTAKSTQKPISQSNKSVNREPDEVDNFFTSAKDKTSTVLAKAREAKELISQPDKAVDWAIEKTLGLASKGVAVAMEAGAKEAARAGVQSVKATAKATARGARTGARLANTALQTLKSSTAKMPTVAKRYTTPVFKGRVRVTKPNRDYVSAYEEALKNMTYDAPPMTQGELPAPENKPAWMTTLEQVKTEQAPQKQAEPEALQTAQAKQAQAPQQELLQAQAPQTMQAVQKQAEPNPLQIVQASRSKQESQEQAEPKAEQQAKQAPRQDSQTQQALVAEQRTQLSKMAKTLRAHNKKLADIHKSQAQPQVTTPQPAKKSNSLFRVFGSRGRR